MRFRVGATEAPSAVRRPGGLLGLRVFRALEPVSTPDIGRNKVHRNIILSLVALCVTGTALADPKGDYEVLFGEEAKKVLASKSTADDAAFAKKLLDAAKAITDAPKTQVFIYEKVVEFGGNAAGGGPHALKAIDILIKAQPDQKAKWQEAKLNVAEKQFQTSRGLTRREAAKAYVDVLIETAQAKAAAGKAKEAVALYHKGVPVATYAQHKLSDIQDQIRYLLFAVQVEAEQKKLAANPGDLPTREKLILLYVTEVDSPPKAAKLLTKSVGDKLRLCVVAASKDLSDVSEMDCLTLGDWYYQSILPKASAAATAKVLLRARNYYDRYLRLHQRSDIISVKVKMQLAKINAAIEKITPAAKPKVVPVEEPLDYNKLEPAKLAKFLEGTWKCTQGPPRGSNFWGFERGKGVHYRRVKGKVKETYFSGAVSVMKDKKHFKCCTREFSIVDSNRIRRHGPPGDMVRVKRKE